MPLKEIKKICCQFEWWNRDLILLKINPVRGWVKSYNKTWEFEWNIILLISGVWEHLWEKVWNNLKCLKRLINYSIHSNCMKVWKWGFVKSKNIQNQIKIWTLTPNLCTLSNENIIFDKSLLFCVVLWKKCENQRVNIGETLYGESLISYCLV